MKLFTFMHMHVDAFAILWLCLTKTEKKLEIAGNENLHVREMNSIW